MNLQGSIIERQNSLLRLYRKLETRFEANCVISALWHDLASDMTLQAQSLKTLPTSFWNQFRKNPDDRLERALIAPPPQYGDITDITLRDSFALTLDGAEAIVVHVYARLVRLLRKYATLPALDFYILVKTYAARVARTTESFAGDPVLARRARLLLEMMEKEIQEPEVELKIPPAPAGKGSIAASTATPAATPVTTKTKEEKKSLSEKTKKTAKMENVVPAQRTPAQATKAAAKKLSATPVAKARR